MEWKGTGQRNANGETCEEAEKDKKAQNLKPPRQNNFQSSQPNGTWTWVPTDLPHSSDH